jgi:hypothetical protein
MKLKNLRAILAADPSGDGRYNDLKRAAGDDAYGFPLRAGVDFEAALALVPFSEDTLATWVANGGQSEAEEDYYEDDEEDYEYEEEPEYDRQPLRHALIPAPVLSYVDEEACSSGHEDVYNILSSVPEDGTLVDVMEAFFTNHATGRLDWFIYTFTRDYGLAEGQLARIQAAVPRFTWGYEVDGRHVLTLTADICTCGNPDCSGSDGTTDYEAYLTPAEYAALFTELWK